MRRNRKIILIILGVFFAFLAVTYFVTPVVIVRPSYNQEAAEELTLIELEELYVEKQPLGIPLVVERCTIFGGPFN